MDNLRLNPTRALHLTTWWAPLALLGLWLPCPTAAAPLLRCHVAYAGTTHLVEASPVADPYPVASVDIGGRFRFKAVMVGSQARIDYVKLYAYLDAKRQPILVQEVKYLPPFKPSVEPYLLTGEQFLYAGPVERELNYRCTLEGVPA
jgi:hypothetical protein